jgi:hypothetical protein
MPSNKKRKNSASARERFEQKYVSVDDRSNPYHFLIPNKADTEKFREIMNTRNYIRILTQLDKNQYIVVQYYIYCEADIWITGESMVLNQNPDKKIWTQVTCSARKARCLCYEEEANEFLSICPKCGEVSLMIKGTPFKCKACEFVLDHKSVNDMPYAKLPCVYCPVELLWEGVSKEIVRAHLQNRSHMVKKLMQEKIDNDLNQLATED